MLRMFCPDQVVASVLDVDLDHLMKKGITALVLDMDNTLLRWDSDEVSAEMKAWVAQARRRGFQLCITSNGLRSRVDHISSYLQVPAIHKAVKPTKRPFRRALAILGTLPQQTAVIGDQIFTDILGGNRMSLHTILINPLGEKELGTTRMMRRMERRVLARLARAGLLAEGAVRMRQQAALRPPSMVKRRQPD